MAIARDNFATNNDTTNSLSTNFTMGSGSNGNLYALVFEGTGSGTGMQTTAVAWNGASLTKLVQQDRAAVSGQWFSAWGIVAPASGAHSLVVSLSSSIDVTVFIVSYTGAAQTLPTGAAVGGFTSALANDATFSLTSIASGSWAVTGVRNLDGSITDSTNYVSLNGDSSVDAGDSNGSTGGAGAVTVLAHRAASRWGGCVSVLVAPYVAAASNTQGFFFR